MDIRIDKIISASELSIDVMKTRALLSEKKELIVFDDNKPQFIIRNLSPEECVSVKTPGKEFIVGEVVRNILKGLLGDNYKEESMTLGVTPTRKQGKITHDMIIGAYPILKKVWHEEISRDNGKYIIEKETGMNAGSAQALITIFLSMMEGHVYKRAFNNDGTQYLLEKIFDDYGKEQFVKALGAAKAHTEYYATLGKGRLRSLEALLEDLRAQYIGGNNDKVN